MILLIFSVIFVLIFIWQQKQAKKYANIPGPPGLPLIGNAIDVFTNNEKKCVEWATKVSLLSLSFIFIVFKFNEKVIRLLLSFFLLYFTFLLIHYCLFLFCLFLKNIYRSNKIAI